MARKSKDSNPEYSASYWGARDAVVSLSRRTVAGLLLLLVGVFGVGLFSAAAVPVLEGTATVAAYPAAIVGAALVLFAAHEMYSL